MARTRLAVPAAIVTSAALIAAGCTTSGTGGGTGGEPFRFAATSDVTTFDPTQGKGATDYTVAGMRFATLVTRDSTGQLIGELAEKWAATPTSATFTLRDGLTCSDGSPLTAGTVAESLRRFADPKTGAAQASGAFGTGNEVTVTADEKSRTVTVKMANPWSDLVTGLSMSGAGIVCEPGLKDPQALGQGLVPGAGTGPYKLLDVQRGRAYTFELREKYKAWPEYTDAPEGERAQKVRLTVVSNESTAANQLSTGALDHAAFTGPDVARFAEGGYTVRNEPLLRMYLVFNQREGHPGTDPGFREAVARAVDPKAFNKVYGGRGEVMLSWSDGGTPCVNTDGSLVPGYEPAAAEKVLDGVSVTVSGTNAVANGAGNTYVQEALRAAGADAGLRNVDNATWVTEVLGGQGDWDITVMAHLNFSGTLTSGASLLSGNPPPDGRNFGAVDDPGLGAAFGRAMATVDEEEKCAAWTDAQEAILTDADVVPLSTVPVSFVFREGAGAVIRMGAADPSTFRVKG